MLVYKEEISTVAMMIHSWRERGRLDLVEKMIGILDIGGEGFDRGLEVGVQLLLCDFKHLLIYSRT